jgi:hypothetical protein
MKEVINKTKTQVGEKKKQTQKWPSEFFRNGRGYNLSEKIK